jgi:hypothetical protein
MAYGTVNADVIQTSTTGGILGAGNASIMKNRIINGAMVIDQRNAGAEVNPAVDGSYYLDRWKVTSTQTGKFKIGQNAGSVTTPAGFTNYLGVTSLSAYSVISTDVFSVFQPIEGFNTADLDFGKSTAKTITISFQVYSSLTGTFSGAIGNSAVNRSYPFTYSVSVANTWTTISVTIAGDTTGTWLTTNGVGMRVFFNLGAGSTYSGTAGAWAAGDYRAVTGSVSVVGTNGATFYITGVQLEVGSSATGFEYVNYQTSLANCQRYYEKSYNVDVVPATNTGSGTFFVPILYINSTTLDVGGSVKFTVTKRANPSILYYTESGTANTWDRSSAGGGSGTLTPTTNRIGTSSFNVYVIGSGFSNIAYMLSGHWTASAEL